MAPSQPARLHRHRGQRNRILARESENSNSRAIPQQRRSILIAGEVVDLNSLRPNPKQE